MRHIKTTVTWENHINGGRSDRFDSVTPGPHGEQQQQRTWASTEPTTHHSVRREEEDHADIFFFFFNLTN